MHGCEKDICNTVYNFVEQYKAFRICGDIATEFFAIAFRALTIKPTSGADAYHASSAVERKWREVQEHSNFGQARDVHICQ